MGNDKYWNDCRPRAVAEYNKRKQKFKQQSTERNLEIEKANTIAFPSNEFNHLVDQVNKFLYEGRHDML